MEEVYTEKHTDVFREPARLIIAGFSNSGKNCLGFETQKEI